MKDQCSAIDEDVFSFLTAGSSIERRDIPGGTAGNQVRRAMEEARDWLAKVSSD